MINDSWTPLWGGGPAHIWEVSNLLVRKHHYQVDVVVPVLTNKSSGNFPKIGEYQNGRLRIIGVGKPSEFPSLFGRLNFIVSALVYCLKNNYDLYHAQYVLPALLLPAIKLIKGKPVAFTLHGKPKEMLGGGLINKLRLPQLFSNLVLYWIPYDLRFTAAASSVNDPRFVTVGNGVNITEFDRVKKIIHKGYKVFWIGRKYDPVKGVKFLDEAVVGLNVDLDLAENVYGIEKIKRFKSADIFVLPSLSEGFPIVLLEAMAAKLPIVTTDVGDCRKLVEEAKCGIVVPAGNAKDLRNAILKLKKDRGHYGENGYKFVKENYTWDKVASVYHSSYCRFNSKLQPQ